MSKEELLKKYPTPLVREVGFVYEVFSFIPERFRIEMVVKHTGISPTLAQEALSDYQAALAN